MSGHSKWSTIKHKKAIEDNRRGKVFTKLAKAITIASKEGGVDESSNFKLRLCVEKAKQANMPKINIERAIEKGFGMGTGESLSEVVYEGYGQANVAVIIEAVTDNKNRTAAEVKKILDRSGGSLGQTGSVGFLFDKKGKVVVEKSENEEEQLLEIIDLGALDVIVGARGVEILVEASQLFEMKNKLEKFKHEVLEAELVYLAKNPLELTEEEKEKVATFLDLLENMDDVQKVFANAKL